MIEHATYLGFVFYVFVCLFVWLVGWLVGWLIGFIFILLYLEIKYFYMRKKYILEQICRVFFYRGNTV